MCQACVARRAVSGDALAVVRLMEASRLRRQLSARSFGQRRERTLAGPTARLAAVLRRLFRVERERVLSLTRGVELPELHPVKEAQAAGSDDMWQMLMQGIDIVQYQAALMESYRMILPATDRKRVV
jgi:hypothetical protein